MPQSSTRPWREAIAALHGLGWEPGAIAEALRVSQGTVFRELGVRVWELPTAPPGRCSQRIGAFWCALPALPGRDYCEQHARLAAFGPVAQERPA